MRDANTLSGYDEALRAGRYVALIPAPADRDEREPLVQMLRDHGATAMNYFAEGGMETLLSSPPHGA